MASSLEMAAEAEIFFNTNWTQTEIDFPDRQFNKDGLTEWISLNYAPVFNDRLCFGRNEYNGLTQVRCYHKVKKLCLKLADDVTEFFNCTQLPKGIIVGIAQHNPPVDLDNGYWEMLVEFDIRQDEA